MKLPNSDAAVVDLDKLRDYCLDPDHPRGRHKARVFEAALGLTAADAELLRTAILHAALTHDARPAETDGFGRRFVLDFHWQDSANQPVVRTSWIVRADEDFPRLTSCYVG